MGGYNYLTQNKNDKVRKSVNVFDLMDTAEIEHKKEKRKTAFITVAALSALVISGYIIISL